MTPDFIEPRWRALFTASTLEVMLKRYPEGTNARLEMLALRARDAFDTFLPELHRVLMGRESHPLQRSASILGSYWQCFSDLPSVCGELHELAMRSERVPCPPLPPEVDPLIATAILRFEPIQVALDQALGLRSGNRT
jgi:hypothetical protein